MRRSFLVGIGVAAVLIFAACSSDQASREPLAPTIPLLAPGQQCGGQLASNISKQQKDLFTDAALTAVETAFRAVNDACPLSAGDPVLQGYIETLITHSQAPTNASRAGALVNLLGSVTLYATGTSLVRPAAIFQLQGGAAVLSPGESMTTGDSRARLEIASTPTPGSPSGPHLWTLEPRPTSECDGTTSLRITGNCYQVHDYPDETVAYSPPFVITLCLRSAFGPTGIGHERSGFGGEVLPEASVVFPCADVHTAMNSWLGREAGPLGRAVAKAYDYLRPRPLFADDAGESGLGLFTSLYGGILNEILKDDFAEFNTPAGPDVGDAWTIQTSSPGYIVINPTGLGDMTGPIVELSQAQGNCANCPTFQLLATRVNSTQSETVGSYDVEWTSLQNKPNVKEAPFVIFNANNNNNEIARLAYTTVSSQNRLIFTVRNGTTVQTIDVGAWVQNVHQDFKVTVNLNVLNNALDQTVSLSINGVAVANAQNIPASRATSLLRIGYILTGIDAGIIASDDWKVTRKPDSP